MLGLKKFSYIDTKADEVDIKRSDSREILLFECPLHTWFTVLSVSYITFLTRAMTIKTSRKCMAMTATAYKFGMVNGLYRNRELLCINFLGYSWVSCDVTYLSGGQL